MAGRTSRAGSPYVDVRIDGHRETWPAGGRQLRLYLQRRCRNAHDEMPSPEQLSALVRECEGAARFDGAEREVALRVVEHNGSIYIDLGDASWRAIEVTRTRWSVVDEPSVRFRRSPGYRQPLFLYHFRAGEMVRTGVCLLMWLLSMAMSSSAMLMAAGRLLPARMPNELILPLMIAWLVMDIISALMPIVLVGPPEPADRPRHAPVSTVQKPETRPEPPVLDGLEQEVVALLNSIANGREVDGVDLLAVGQIRTTQRTLGEALNTSAATINRL